MKDTNTENGVERSRRVVYIVYREEKSKDGVQAPQELSVGCHYLAHGNSSHPQPKKIPTILPVFLVMVELFKVNGSINIYIYTFGCN